MESFSILMWKIDGFTARFGGGGAWLVDGWCHSAAHRRVNNNTCLTTTKPGQTHSRHNTRPRKDGRLKNLASPTF